MEENTFCWSLIESIGGGRLADVLLWRRRKLSASILGLSTVAWFLFEVADYNILTLLANALLLLIAILFFWARSASLLHRPLPPLPNLELSNQTIDQLADRARFWVNQGLAVARDVAIGHDRKLFLKVLSTTDRSPFFQCYFVLVACLVCWWLCNFLTFLYIVVVTSFSLPALYERYQDRLDDKLIPVYALVKRHLLASLKHSNMSTLKEKKED